MKKLLLLALLVVASCATVKKNFKPEGLGFENQCVKSLFSGDGWAAEATCGQCLKNNADSYICLNGMGIVESSRGNLKEAEKLFMKAAKIDKKQALAYNNLGSLLLQQGDVEGAQVMFFNAMEADPNDTTAKLGAAMCYIKRASVASEYERVDLVKKAYALFKEVLIIDPNNEDAQQMIKVIEGFLGRLVSNDR